LSHCLIVLLSHCLIVSLSHCLIVYLFCKILWWWKTYIRDNETMRQWDNKTMRQWDNETMRQWDKRQWSFSIHIDEILDWSTRMMTITDLVVCLVMNVVCFQTKLFRKIRPQNGRSWPGESGSPNFTCH
jgi:hypothetical protein